MYPYLLPEIFGRNMPMYDLMIVIGVVLMLFYIIQRLENTDGYTRAQTNKIIILIIISLLFALISSYVLDGVFHSIKEGELTFGSLNFLSGLIGGFVGFFLLMKYFYKDDNMNMRQIANTAVTGVVLAHAFGRIGCFFAGCCYGIPTESFLGVMFDSGHAPHVYPNEYLLPTQLFESAFLFGLFVIMNKVSVFRNKELEVYLVGYGIWRIFIEFFRGDDRGVFLNLFSTKYNSFPTPAQLISLLMIALGAYLLYKRKK